MCSADVDEDGDDVEAVIARDALENEFRAQRSGFGVQVEAVIARDALENESMF